MSLSKSFIRYFALAALIAIILAIFIGGTQPGAGSLFPPPWDKLVHLITYGFMLLLALLAFPKGKPMLLACAIILLGALDEIHQIYIPGRSAGFDDLAADIVGILIVYFVWIWFRNKKAH